MASRMFKSLLRSPAAHHVGGFLLATLIRNWMRQLDYKGIGIPRELDPAFVDPERERYLYLFWHENVLPPLYLRGQCDLTMLASPHDDGNWLERTARLLGFGVVRGSSNARRVEGLKRFLREGTRQHLTIVPDGPRGPRRTMAGGSIYVASRLQMPIVCLGIGVAPAWRLSSWDRFVIPRPDARVRFVVSGPWQIPRQLTAPQFEQHRLAMENELNAVTEEAEAWAASNKRRRGQIPIRKQTRKVRLDHPTTPQRSPRSVAARPASHPAACPNVPAAPIRKSPPSRGTVARGVPHRLERGPA